MIVLYAKGNTFQQPFICCEFGIDPTKNNHPTKLFQQKSCLAVWDGVKNRNYYSERLGKDCLAKSSVHPYSTMRDEEGKGLKELVEILLI